MINTERTDECVMEEVQLRITRSVCHRLHPQEAAYMFKNNADLQVKRKSRNSPVQNPIA